VLLEHEAVENRGLIENENSSDNTFKGSIRVPF